MAVMKNNGLKALTLVIVCFVAAYFLNGSFHYSGWFKILCYMNVFMSACAALLIILD